MRTRADLENAARRIGSVFACLFLLAGCPSAADAGSAGGKVDGTEEDPPVATWVGLATIWPRLGKKDVTGTYFGTSNSVDRELVCATADRVVPGGMRIKARTVQFADGDCEIANREQRVEEKNGEVSVQVELGLVCWGERAGPGGLSATLYVGAHAEMTSYVSVDSDRVPAHSMFMPCPP